MPWQAGSRCVRDAEGVYGARREDGSRRDPEEDERVEVGERERERRWRRGDTEG